MTLNRRLDRRRASVVKEGTAVAESPERRRANLGAGGGRLIANPSDTDARVLLRFYPVIDYRASPNDEHIDVPARRAISFPAPAQYNGWLVVTSESRGSAAPTPIVVERVPYVDVDGVRRARQVSIVGNVTH